MILFDWIFILCIAVILFTAIGILIGVFIMIKPVIRRDEPIDYHGADKLGLTCNDDEESTDDLKCLKCGSKNLTGSATKGYGIFYCLDCGYTSEFNTETDFQVCDYGCELIKEEQGNK